MFSGPRMLAWERIAASYPTRCQKWNRLFTGFTTSCGMGHALFPYCLFRLFVYWLVDCWLTNKLYNFRHSLLFPELPNEEYVHLATETVSGVANHCTEESVPSSALLHPLLFPRLYPPLFTLYALQNERADSAYWERILQLNKRSDWALMTYVGMKR